MTEPLRIFNIDEWNDVTAGIVVRSTVVAERERCAKIVQRFNCGLSSAGNQTDRILDAIVANIRDPGIVS